MDKLHAQEQKQQERLEELRASLKKDYEVKCNQLQDELEEKSVAAQSTAETDFQQKLISQLSERQAEHEKQLAKLQKELKDKEDAIKELEEKDQTRQDSSRELELLKSELERRTRQLQK